MAAIVIGVRWNLRVVVVCISFGGEGNRREEGKGEGDGR
jgi:hypothetical protein